MKVLYVHTYYMQRGGEDIVYESERALMAANGWEVQSVLFNNKKFAAIKFLFLFFNPYSFIRVCRAIDRYKPDVVHIHNWFFGASPSVFLAVKWKRIPLVHTIHNFRILCPSAVLFNRGHLYLDSIKKRFPLLAVRRRVYKNSYFFSFWLLTCTRLNLLLGTWASVNQFICLTKTSKDILSSSIVQVDPKRITVKPNFVPETPFLNDRVRNSDFLFVGRLAEEKGLQSLMTAFKNSEQKLKIIGDGPLGSKVAAYAKENANVTFLGFQPKEQIIEEMGTCGALIMPSICYEQFGLVIIEALSCGTAVIASNIGAPKDLVTEHVTGLHFEAGSAEDLKDKLDIWQHTTAECKASYYENARLAYCSNFTAQSNFTQLSMIYKSEIDEQG